MYNLLRRIRCCRQLERSYCTTQLRQSVHRNAPTNMDGVWRASMYRIPVAGGDHDQDCDHKNPSMMASSVRRCKSDGPCQIVASRSRSRTIASCAALSPVEDARSPMVGSSCKSSCPCLICAGRSRSCASVSSTDRSVSRPTVPVVPPSAARGRRANMSRVRGHGWVAMCRTHPPLVPSRRWLAGQRLLRRWGLSRNDA